jgi:hypothetical protein
VSGLGEAMGRLLGVGAGAGDWLTQLTELREQLGSGRAVARHLDVNESTVRRMLAGKTRAPKPTTLEKLRRGSINRDVPHSAVVLHTRDRDRNRDRTLRDSNLRLAEGTMRRVADAYIATGDLEAAGAAFLAGVTVAFYQAYLRPRDVGELAPVEDEGGDHYYDDEGNAYDAPDDDDLPYYDDFDEVVDDFFPFDAEAYGGDVA